jgi:DNA-binding beta-propeller fold protein YncE
MNTTSQANSDDMVSVEKKLELVNTFLTSLRARNWDLMATIFTDDCTWSLPGTSYISGDVIGAAAVIDKAQRIVSFNLNFQLNHVLYGSAGVALSLGKWIALTHKDVGKVTVVNTKSMSIEKVINTGAITNHVTFSVVNNKLLMMATIGGENKVRIFDVANNFNQTDTINVGALPHGIWPSPDGKLMYNGLEYGDQVQGIDVQSMKVISTIKIGQSPQALV